MVNKLEVMRLGKRLDEIKASLNLLEKYLVDMENFLEAEAQNEQQRLQEIVQEQHQKIREDRADGKQIGMKETDISSIIEYGVPEWEIVSNLSQILRRSFFVSLYSFLEAQLDEECRYHKKSNDNILLSLEDIKEKGVTRAKIYWEKCLKLPFPENSYWGDIHKGYRNLRNCIVHNDGKLNQNFISGNDTLRKFIENKNCRNSISLQDKNIILHKDFCSKTIKTIRKFFEKLFLELGVADYQKIS